MHATGTNTWRVLGRDMTVALAFFLKPNNSSLIYELPNKSYHYADGAVMSNVMRVGKVG